ncbi:hypothetical protein [uncultured Pseudomonas sp.]|uniref:hypothetical protein n=1 Tax=uncultured Pseudomonas sp. TaxID=114707 RepID=UPI0025FA0BE9|nr:hypothetical protein [uncultured Pseudomonas sp.]
MMKTRYKKFNLKRRVASRDTLSPERLTELAGLISYGGNPEHKKNPGDFGLTPPADPRPGKSLCDIANVFSRDQALHLLIQGVERGLVSDREDNVWPKNIWSVAAGSIALEAQLENPETGRYHGYPMPGSDPLAAEILGLWRRHG